LELGFKWKSNKWILNNFLKYKTIFLIAPKLKPTPIYLFDQHENIIGRQKIEAWVIIWVLGIAHHGICLPAACLAIGKHSATRFVEECVYYRFYGYVVDLMQKGIKEIRILSWSFGKNYRKIFKMFKKNKNNIWL
jgi:hypothetical protein